MSAPSPSLDPAFLAALLVACLGQPSCAPRQPGDNPEVVESAVIVGSRTPPGILSSQHRVSADLASHPLAASASCGTSPLTAGAQVIDAAATSDGRQLATLLIACALPPSDAVSVPGTEVTFVGDVGLAPGWGHRPLTAGERRWVTACALARLSGTSVEVPISLRGARPALHADPEERSAFATEEGAFYGDVLDPETLDQPLRWFACQGTGQARAGDRVCATPDPATPGLTRCGLQDAGSCDVACRRSRPGAGRRRCWTEGEEFDEVATAYLSP